MSLQTTIARLVLKLPNGILRAMSGGAPVEIGGRVLDPHFQFLAHAAAKRPAPTTAPTAQDARAQTRALVELAGGQPEPGVRWQDQPIPVDGRTIPARLYISSRPRPGAVLMVYFHFGGGVVGDLETCHAFCTMLCAALGAPVLSVDYRLAPEHPWPAGLQDALDSFLWARQNAERLGGRPGAAAVGGDSMGGNFAAIIAQEMARMAQPQPFLQLLIYPATDLAASGGSMDLYGESFPLTAATMAFFMANYLPDGADTSDPRLSPMKADDLEGLAPALLFTAGFDPLCDQGRAYADRLEASRVNVLYRCYDSLAHGFTAFTAVSPAADVACRQIATETAKAYAALGA
jgi:acetyl esterase/lipase